MNILVDMKFMWPSERATMYSGMAVELIAFVNTIPEEHKDRYTLLFNKESEEEMHALFPDYKYVSVDFSKKSRFALIDWLKKKNKFKRFVSTYQADIYFNLVNTDYVTWFTFPYPYVGVHHDLSLLRNSKFSLRSLFYQLTLPSYYRYKFKHCSHIISISNFVKEDAINYFHLDQNTASKFTTIYNTVLKINNSSEPSGYDFSNKYILTVNAVRPSKNLETLFKAFALIKDRTELNLILVGATKNNIYWDKTLNPLINELNISDRIFVLQNLKNEELRYIYEKASLFITTSLREGFGNTPIEAAYYGCPVISTTCESLPEVTMGLVNYYEPPTDEIALSNLILKILETPPTNGELEKISGIFLERYNSQNRTSEIEKVFEAIIRVLS